MIRHIGKERSFYHNLCLAVLLCLNAGFINAAGFLAFGVLTTNVTGHAALFAIKTASMDFRAAKMAVLWLFLFLAGAFFSSLFISTVGRDKPYAYSAPIISMIVIVLSVAIFGPGYDHTLAGTGYFAGSLLFGMGMQNALVSMISGSVVRTTHLTGMFTDLGIDLSGALLSYKNVQPAVKQRIVLKSAIIVSFLLGGTIGGALFLIIFFRAFYVPVALMVILLFYDYFQTKIINAILQGKTPGNGH